MLRFVVTSLHLFAVCLMTTATLCGADEPGPETLRAPAGWGGETIQLPPGFAPDMKLNGLEHIRFAPGMMKPDSATFFCYAFVFELKPQPALTDAVIKAEFLKYFRGLCKAVLNGQHPDVDPSKFTLELTRVKSNAKPTPNAEPSSDKQATAAHTRYTGTLEWVEPFATQKPQTLNLEIQSWAGSSGNHLFVCVSPQARDTAIWKKLHTIRDNYLSDIRSNQ